MNENQIIDIEAEPEISPAMKKKILKERASVLAKPPVKETDKGAEMDGVGFLLSGENYIIDASYVLEVIPLREITPLPCTPQFLLGIINLRGRILSVINLKSFLNLQEKGTTNLNRVIIVKHEDIEVGLLVDEVTGNLTVFMDELGSNISTLTSAQKEYLIGVTKERAILFNIEKFLSDGKIIINEEV